MKFLIIGAGLMGRALAYDLVQSNSIDSVTLADIHLERAREIARKIDEERVRPVKLDANYFDDLINVMTGQDCAISAISFRYNFALTQAAIEADVHLCDLGGNNEVLERQLKLDAKARGRNLSIVPNCGLAPGLANILAARGAEKFSAVDSIRIRVGGLPQHPKPPLNYQLVFSAEGLVNEYTGKALILRDYKIEEVDAMTEIESIEFPQPFGTLEAFHTSGGSSTLPKMFEGKVRKLDYKTIRYPGHCEHFKELLDVGFASSEPIAVGSNLMTAKEMFYELLRKKLSDSGPDVVLLRVEIQGERAGTSQTLTYNLIDFYQENHNITAMMRTTAFPTSVIAQMICDGKIFVRGVVPPEQYVPLEPLLDELKSRSIKITEEWS